MPSSFKDTDLFGSGPHRFIGGRQGRRVVALSSVTGDPSVPGTFESGDFDLRIEVRGRLIADDETDLWALRDAIAAEAAFETTSGTLEDHHGRQWTDIYLLNVEWDDAVARGRTLSIGYTAFFGRLTT